MRLCLWVLGAALAAGLVRFALARPAIEVRFPRTQQEPAGTHDLALFLYGPTLRVSSADFMRGHHPGYLLDGWDRPSLLEKWASDPSDRAPWAEVQLDRPREIVEVAMELAGAHESAEVPQRRYRIECWSGDRQILALPVEGNLDPRPRHAVACPASDRVRVSFALDSLPPDAVARVYELEVRGQ